MLDKLTKLNVDNSQELWRLSNHTYPSLQKLIHQTEIKILISSHWPASHNLHISAHRHIHTQLSPASLPPVPTRERILNLRVPFHLPTRSQAINDGENPQQQHPPPPSTLAAIPQACQPSIAVVTIAVVEIAVVEHLTRATTR